MLLIINVPLTSRDPELIWTFSTMTYNLPYISSEKAWKLKMAEERKTKPKHCSVLEAYSGNAHEITVNRLMSDRSNIFGTV